MKKVKKSVHDSLVNRKVNINQLTLNKTIIWIGGFRYRFEIVNYEVHVYICGYIHIQNYIPIPLFKKVI